MGVSEFFRCPVFPVASNPSSPGRSEAKVRGTSAILPTGEPSSPGCRLSRHRGMTVCGLGRRAGRGESAQRFQVLMKVTHSTASRSPSPIKGEDLYGADWVKSMCAPGFPSIISPIIRQNLFVDV